jgi:hypothetical protein
MLDFTNFVRHEVLMFRRSYRHTRHRNTQPRGPFNFMRKPIVQLSILGIAALLIVIIASTGGK